MSRVLPYVEDAKKFCRRYRTFANGRARLTPYTWGYGKRPETGPRGGRLYREFPRMVWDMGGTLCKSKRVKDGAGNWVVTLFPIDGTVSCAHPIWAERHGYCDGSVTLDHGKPARVDRGGACLWVPDMGDDYLAALTGIGEK
jgi:hypothetical protein